MSYTVKLRKVPKNFKKGMERHSGTLNLRETQSNESEIMYSDYKILTVSTKRLSILVPQIIRYIYY